MSGRVLIVAGSDSGGGAGIQADIKTVTMLDGFAATAITALTAQNTEGVFGVLPVAPDFHPAADRGRARRYRRRRDQDRHAARSAVIETVAAVLAERRRRIPLVVDPVMVAKGGAPLIETDAIDALKRRLIAARRGADPEPARGRNPAAAAAIADVAAMRAGGASAARRSAAGAVLLKGGHLAGDTVHDVLATAGGRCASGRARASTPATPTAPAARWPRRLPPASRRGWRSEAAVERARDYVQRAIASAPGFGHGHGPLDHAHPLHNFSG